MFGEVAGSESVDAEVAPEPIAVEVRVTGAGCLILIRTYGIGLLETGTKPSFFAILGSERRSLGFVVILGGDSGWGFSFSVSLSLREGSMIVAAVCHLEKSGGSRGGGGGNSEYTSLMISSRVFRGKKATSCRCGDEPKHPSAWRRLLESSGMHDNSGEGGSENEDKDPGDNENDGEGTKVRVSGLSVLRAWCA